ncbi:UvrD-helicase domain-containing protein [Streptomyces zaomyceticus]|uniref:UvrD-helicase domain-containing protein n=1 Tax=Streptomyces zaomyceticus TaxID=68286 RepID=UPI002E23A02C
MVRLWGGKLAVVRRALPNDRILVQDQSAPGAFNGRRHTTSAKWVSMVARPDGTAPTDNEQKVQEEDARRSKNPRRGNGVALDDDGDPTTPFDPHDADDQGRPIGDDDPDGPEDDDDEDEPADGRLPVNVSALPNKRHSGDGRFDDIAAVRQHFLDLADAPGQTADHAEFLRFAAGRDDLRTTDDGNLVILLDLRNGGYDLTATGTGQRMSMAGKFDTPQDAARFARHLARTAPTDDTQARRDFDSFDFSDPDLDGTAKTWRSSQGENIVAAIKRAREEFDNGAPPAPHAPKADSAKKPETQPLKHDWDTPENLATVTMPAVVAAHVFEDDTWPMQDPDTRKAYDDAKRGRTGNLKITAPLEVHDMLLEAAEVLSGGGGDATSDEISAHGKYARDVAKARREQRQRQKETNAPQPTPDAPTESTAPEADGKPTPDDAEPYDPTRSEQVDPVTRKLTFHRTPKGVKRDVAGRFGVGEPLYTPGGETFVVVSGNPDGTINARHAPLYYDQPLGRRETFRVDEVRSLDGTKPWWPEAAARAAQEEDSSDEVTLTPDEVNAPAAAARAAKAPSAMDNGEIRDEIVSLMEREMADGGLSGVDRTRMTVLEAEEARRAGRKPKEESKPKPKTPAEEPGGLFDAEPDQQQRHVPDPNNPDDLPNDATGTPDMFADAEGRDTSRLRPVQTRAPKDFQQGDRFVDADGRTHTVAKDPIRTGRGRVRVVTEDGREHFLSPDTELRVLGPDEDAPKPTGDETPRDNPAPEESNAPADTDGPADDTSEGPSAPQPEDDTDNSEPAGGRAPADMSPDELADEIEDLENVTAALESSTDPLELAYRLRAERRLWALQREEADRWQPEPEYDERGDLVAPSRGSVLLDRVTGHGLNQDEARGAVSSVDELPAAKPGSYSDDEWETIEAAASAKEEYPPTDEQQVIIEGAARRGLDMRVMALAGTGKSTTLKMLSQRMPGKRILYLAFNRSVADEAIESQQRGEYARNLTPTTANAYANSMVDRDLLDRLKWQRLNDQQIADRMRWRDSVQAGGDSLSPRRAAYYANKLLSEWAKSDDTDFAAHHLPEELNNREAVFEAVKPLAERMWANLNDPKAKDKDRDLPLSFDHTVKMWALSGRVPETDVLFWDEAQDVNPVMEGIVRNIRAAGVQVVAVGDSNQAIYGFRGATDALGRLPADATATLTQTFRFGDDVADAGNRFLRLTGSRMRLRGWDRKDSRRAQINPGDETMLIARTNAGVVLGAVEGLQAGRKVAVAGGLNDLRKFLEAAQALQAGKRTTHQDLAQFNGMDWEAIREEVDGNKDHQQLNSLFKLMDRHNDSLQALLDSVSMPRPLVEDDGEHLWVKFSFGDSNFEATKDWLKRQGFGWDGVTKRWGYPPPKRGNNVPDQERTRVLQKVEQYIADRYTAPATGNGGQIVDQSAPHDLLVSTAHKAKGLESERVRIADDFRGPKETPEGGVDWDTIPEDEELRLAYVAVTRATDVLDTGSLGWVFDVTRGDDPLEEPDGEYTRDWKISDFQVGNKLTFWTEDGESLTEGTVRKIDGIVMTVRTPSGSTEEITSDRVARREGQDKPLLSVASPEELDAALSDGRFVPPQGDTVRISQDEVRETLERIRPESNTDEEDDNPDDGAPDTSPASENGSEKPDLPRNENETARAIRDRLPDLPELPKLTGLSRQDKDTVRRIRGDYAKVLESLDGIIAEDPPTGDAREDLRRVRENLDFIAQRLTRQLLPDSDQAQTVQASLYELGQDLDRILSALPERAPQSQGKGPNGGTLFRPWDLQDGDLVRFDAVSPNYRSGGLAPYFGHFRGSSTASGDHGSTLVSYQGREWNDDRQQWEPKISHDTVIMPPRGLVERFTEEEWDAWRRPQQSQNEETPEAPKAPAAPIGDASPRSMSNEDIAAELEALQAWQNRHVSSDGEGPRVEGNAWLALSPVGSRRGDLWEEQRLRENARRDQEKKEKAKQERAAALARTEIGKRNGDGSYPIAVDGNDAGTVSQLARKWQWTNSEGDRSPDFYGSRAEAAAALVGNVDLRQSHADDRERQEQARRETPDGWVLGDRADVAENDIIRVPVTETDREGRPYPVRWRDPVRVNRVSRNDDGTLVLSVSNPDGSYSNAGPIFLGPDHTFAWADGRTRPEPTPEWKHEIRVRMGDIGDDIATLQRKEGLQDPERVQRLQDLIQRVSQGETDDLQGDLRQIRDEAAWLESQFDDPDLDLPYETRRYKSWATAARMKAESSLQNPAFQNTDGPDNGPDTDAPNNDDRASRAQSMFGEGMNAVGGDSLPEMQELDERLGRADSADDRDAELRDIADRMDALAEQYELAGPQGELAADRFRGAARLARGEQDEQRNDDQADNDLNETTAAPASDDEQQNEDQDEEQQDNESRQQRRDGDADGGSPDGEPNGGGTGTPDGPGNDDGDGNDTGDDPDGESEDDDEERRRRRRRRRRDGGGNEGPGGGGPGGPGLPHLNLPASDTSAPAGDDSSRGTDEGDGGRGHRDIDSLRTAWRNGEGLSPSKNTPKRRAFLAALADREGLALSRDGGLAIYPETQADGTTQWRFVQARNGTGLQVVALTADNPDDALELAGRFEDLADGNGDPFDWHQEWGAASIMAWRDGEGRSLAEALRAVRDDFEQERAGAFVLPEDLTTLSDPDLEAAYLSGLGPEDEQRVIDEMDRRDGYVDARVREAIPDTPPANAEEAAERRRAMDEALRFGDTDVTQPAPATPGRLRREFDALDEERYQAAMEATGGRMLSPEAEDQGVDPRAVFSGRKYNNKQALELASPELRRWIEGDDETPGNGRLTYAGYRQRETDRALHAEFAEWDEARYRQAIDDTNGYFFRREFKYRGDGPNERELFSGGSLTARDRWRQYASEELQEWFDLNGGRQTFAQFKQARRDGDRAERHQFEEEQKRAAEESETPTADVVDVADIQAPTGSARHGETEEDAAFRFGGRDRLQEFADRAELRPVGDGDAVWLDGRRIGHVSNLNRSSADREPLWDARPFFGIDVDRNSRSYSRDAAIANLVVQALQDGPDDPANPNEHMWDSVKARLAGLTHELPDLPPRLQNNPEARARHDRLKAMIDAFRAKQSPSGDLRRDLVQARDDFAWLRSTLPHTRKGGPERDVLDNLDNRVFWAHLMLDGFGPDRDLERPRSNDPQGDDETETPDVPTPDAPETSPELSPEPPATPDPEPDPEPIGGQPAHWARVEDLVPGDMVRMNGTTRQGRRTQRAGYVGNTGPQLVDVTRRGRTEQMWRTWVTENPDGTGASGNVYTSANATAARAEAPDDVVPGSPASGAQSSVRSGDLPNQVPTDRDGRGLFPGSTVTGTGNREGTVTGATDTTVAVRWNDGDEETALSPTTLTVTEEQRPDGWTPDGQRVTPSNVVSDSDGTLLGPVDDVDGDDVTISTADGTVTRSAGSLRVTGEVRDDAPDPGPVSGIDEPAAGDLEDGDVVLLDLDGNLTTVAITGSPERDGDRVTLQYADTTTGEVGEIDVDARAVLPRAQGPDGGAPDLGPDDAPDPDDDLTIHQQPSTVEPVTGPTIDPELDSSDRSVIGDHADGPDDDPDAHQAAVRITTDLPVTPQQATALATQLRATADPATLEGRAALRAADHLDQSAGRTPPPGFDRPRASNAAQVGEGDLIAMPDERHGDRIRAFRVLDVEDGPGGVRSFLLEDENQHWRRRVVHGAMPVWQLPEATPEPVTPPDPDNTDTTPEMPTAPTTPDTPTTPDLPIAQVRPGSLRAGDVIDAPVSRTGYQLNGHRKLTIISEPQRNGWWMQLTGIDEDGNVHDFGLHSGRAVNVYDRNRPTPTLPATGAPRDPNQSTQADTDRLASDHARTMAARIIDEAIAGTDPAGDIHALREQIAQRLTPEALADARQSVRRDGIDSLNAAGLTGDDRAAAQRRLRDARQRAHTQTVKAALRTINDLEPLPDESNEDLAARARDLLRLIPGQIADRQQANSGGDAEINRAVTGHIDEAVNALMQQLQEAGVDAGDAEQIARILAQQMGGSRQRAARRIASRVAAASPAAGRRPGLLAQIVALLIRAAKRLVELVKAAARKIAEKYRNARERMARMRAFLGRLVQRVRRWPESRRLARLHRAVNLPDADGDTLAARVSHWAGLMPETGRFGQSQRRVTFWRPTTWGQLAAGRLPDRSDRIQWTPDRAADGGPGLTGLRHLAALRAAGGDVDQDVNRRLSAALGDDFGDDPHDALQHADDYVAASERRYVNLQAARRGGTIPDDADLEIEIEGARAELASARREYADLRARYAAAVPDAVAAALSDIRDMGPEGSSALVFGPDTDPDAERAVRGVQRLIPRSWLNSPEGRRLTAVSGSQGRYEPDTQRVTVADLADDGLGTAGHALAQHFARHLGDLDAAQRAYWFTRTHTGRPGARRMRMSALDRLLRRQQTQPETGDSLAQSIQAMFSGDWYQDDDLRAFLLGLMATR